MVPNIPNTTIMNQLQSPTVTVSDGTLQANTLFNTGLATQLSPQFAMAIYAIRWNFFMSAPTLNQNVEDAILGTISEDVAATVAADELTDPRTLAESGVAFDQHVSTNVGAEQFQQSMLWTSKFNPPIWTVAQRLNIIGEIVEAGAGTAPTYQIHGKIYYTVETISDEQLRKLVQRLNLATQP